MFVFNYVNELIGWSEGTKRKKKDFSAHGLEPWTSGLWAPHATTAPS
jgi:hypothetical protein